MNIWHVEMNWYFFFAVIPAGSEFYYTNFSRHEVEMCQQNERQMENRPYM